ncbi:nucleoside recognition domain-containing protein [Cohnella sp. GCM10027633]|uniref:nucleoside recognition domain-containing protein n=1 Tax=unclassified Cohnella TaxID=2636738 RepID=UPI00362EE8F2
MRTEPSSTNDQPRLITALSIVGMGGVILLLGGLALAMPGKALEASLRGVAVWWEVLFPALFPFFVLSDVMLGFGIVHFAGKLLDPFMRPVFKLPGIGGFVLAMGYVSGYPVGARLTSRLMEQRMIDRDQGERLVAMTTTSDPIFLIGAVCIGFFGSLEPALALAIAHYGSALLIGILYRFRPGAGADSPEEDRVPRKPSPTPQRRDGRLRAALAAMHRARLADGRPFAVLLRQSLQSSLALMMIVGGLVVFFSATMTLLIDSGALALFHHAISGLLQLCGMSPHIASSLIHGTFEVTIGAKAAAGSGAAGSALPLVDRVAAAAFVLSWAGLSVHAQVAGLMSRTKWRYLPFARARLLHGILAMIAVYAVWPLLHS